MSSTGISDSRNEKGRQPADLCWPGCPHDWRSLPGLARSAWRRWLHAVLWLRP